MPTRMENRKGNRNKSDNSWVAKPEQEEEGGGGGGGEDGQ